MIRKEIDLLPCIKAGEFFRKLSVDINSLKSKKIHGFSLLVDQALFNKKDFLFYEGVDEDGERTIETDFTFEIRINDSQYLMIPLTLLNLFPFDKDSVVLPLAKIQLFTFGIGGFGIILSQSDKMRMFLSSTKEFSEKDFVCMLVMDNSDFV